MIVTGKVEESEQVAIADVEEEMRRSCVVTILDDLDEREAEEPLIELDGLLDVLADQCDVMHAPGGGRRSIRILDEVSLAQNLPVRPDLVELCALWLRHRRLLSMSYLPTLDGGEAIGKRVRSRLRRTSRPGGRVCVPSTSGNSAEESPGSTGQGGC